MDKNQIIFLLVTFLFIIGYYYFIYPKFAPVNQTQVIEQSQKEMSTDISNEQTKIETKESATELDNLLAKKEEIKTIELNKDDLISRLSSSGGAFTYILMDKNENIVTYPEKNMFLSTDLLAISDNSIQYFQPIYFNLFENDNQKVVLKKQFLDLSGKNCEIEKIVEKVDKYRYQVIISIKGLQNNIPKLDKNISLLSFSGFLGPEELLTNKNNKQEIFYSFAKRFNSIRISKKNYSTIADFDWIDIQNLYFTVIIEKANANNANGIAFINQDNSQVLYIKANALDLVENTYKFNIYTLPKERKVLISYKKDFEKILNRFGILNPIVIAFEYLLNWLNSFLNSWGFSIIVLALIVKILLFPLTRQSTISMKKISQLNPQIKEIQEKYKDNPQKANIEMQALYKREKINPLSGCLPLLLQFPFLIALYNVLIYSHGLRGASFLWIKDLSVGDVILKLPFNIPLLGPYLRLLPFIMLITQLGQTIFQSKSQVASTKEQEMQSKLMMWLFPIVFFFVLYNMSSGLILYWTCLNLLSIIETSAISYIEGKKIEVAKK